MRDLSSEGFRQHLLDKYSLTPGARARAEKPGATSLMRPLKDLWEATDLSAAEFADEVSDYWNVARLDLPQLLGAIPCLEGFSRRFLREATVFPMRASGGYRLAIADPSDTAAIRESSRYRSRFAGTERGVIARARLPGTGSKRSRQADGRDDGPVLS